MFSKTTRDDEPETSVQSEQAEPKKSKYKKRLPLNWPRPRFISPEILLSCLDNLSEEAIFGSNQIMEQHETMKLQKEEITLKNT